MNVVYIGTDVRISELAIMSVRLRWPDSTSSAAATATEGLELVNRVDPDLVMLHPDFTDMSLSQALQELRSFSNVPLMVLGSEGDEMELITALENDADDYIGLPCDLTEITTRVWALLRRVDFIKSGNRENLLLSGGLLIHPATDGVFLAGERIILTPNEFRLLHLLMRNRGTVVSRRELQWAFLGGMVDSPRLLNRYIQRLRRKLGDDSRAPRWIASVRGVGYRFVGPAPSAPESAGRPSGRDEPDNSTAKAAALCHDLSEIQELDTIVLTHAIGEHGLEVGDVGTVVHQYRDGEAFEVEFVTQDGNTIALLTLSHGDIRPMGRGEILHVRQTNTHMRASRSP